MMARNELPTMIELQVLRDIKDVIVVLQDGVIRFVNRTLPRHGYTAEELIGRPAFELEGLPPESMKMAEALYVECQEDQEPAFFQTSVICKDGSPMLVEVAAGSTRFEDRPAIIASVRDNTSQVQAQRELAESENIIRSLCDVAFEGIVIHQEGIVQEANQAFCKLLGCLIQEVRGRSAYDFLMPEARGHVSKREKAGRERPYSAIALMKNGQQLPVELVGKNITYKGEPARIMAVRDLTKQKELEEERLQLQDRIEYSQKLESLFVMAGGIAHDLNNMLMGIMGNASLALHHLPSGTIQRTYVEQIEAASQRITELTKQLLAFSGCAAYRLEPIQLPRLITAIVADLEKSKKGRIRFEVVIDEDLPMIAADANEIRQVVENLVANAIEAYDDETGPVHIQVGCREIDKEFFGQAVPHMENMPLGRCVFLEVRDFGCGMDTRLRAKMFDPFFTTKFTGRGLGLPVVLGVSRVHQWGIAVASEVNKGSTFTLFIPAKEEARPEEVLYQTDKPTTSQTTAKNTVLVIDDEEIVLQVTQKMLAMVDYRVLVAKGGQAGIDLYRNHQDEILFVLLDATMPGLDGYATFQELKHIQPTVKVVLCSGYDKKVTSRFASSDIVGFLQKPYRLNDVTALLDKIALQQADGANDSDRGVEHRIPLQ